MSWFEDQVNARRKNDRDSLNEAYGMAMNAIIGESFSFDEAEDDISIILRYYHLNPVKGSDKIEDDNEKLEAVCRLSGLKKRPVKLDAGWYKYAFGAFLCKYRDSEEYVAVIPGKYCGYSFYDKKNHRRVKLNSKTATLLSDEAICFYKPFPSKKLTVRDVVLFGLSSWKVSDYVLTFGLLAISTLLGMMLPKLTNFLYSTVLEEASISLLASTIVFMLTINLSLLFLNSMQKLFTARTSVKMGAAIQSATMMRVLSMPVEFFRQYSSGEIMNRMGYVEAISSQIVSIIFGTSLSGLFSLCYITQIFRFAPSLVAPSLCVIAANILFSLYTTLRQIRITRRQMELAARNSGMGIEMISGIQKVKMSGSEKRIFARYTISYSEQAKITYNPPFFNKYNIVISMAIGFIGTLALYFSAVTTNVSVADYYAFQAAYGTISGALTSLASIAIDLANLRPGLEMARPMLETLPETIDGTQDVLSLSGEIEINNISFKYSDASSNVINNFSLKIRPGQYIAIVGKTGCGKSTLVRLLLGFEKPQKGSIYYDGKDLNTLEKQSLRQKIGTVMQDSRLFMGDIYSNIVICAPTLSMDKAWEAAELAGIADDIREMPMGMHTLISDGSGSISGGQRQRIAIARAIAPKPKILIMDEATSALDNITQKQVAESLATLNCTRIVIAHRLSTIRQCDRILVMDEGRIIEDGTYEELVEKNGFFADLVNRQRLDT